MDETVSFESPPPEDVRPDVPAPGASRPMVLLPPRTLRALLMGSAGALTALGLGVEVAYYRGGLPGLAPVVAFFSLSYEQNLPTWYAAGLLLVCAGLLATIARAATLVCAPRRAHWWGLAAGFLYASLDEAVGLHEHLGVLELHGALYFSWVVPAAAVVVLLAGVYLPFLQQLPARRRRQFLVAGTLYVAGALGMELPLGWWTERHGNDNLVYALVDHVEEALELVGVSLFLSALVEELGERVRLILREEEVAHGRASAGTH